MTFSERVKSEILLKTQKQPCCKIAMLSAFVRGAGTIVSAGGKIGFEIISENKRALELFKENLYFVYGVQANLDSISGRRKYKLSLINGQSLLILKEIGIIQTQKSDVFISFSIDKYLVENECCKQAYISSAFIGGGSVTVPEADKNTVTSYHLEFVFSNQQTASDFADLLAQTGFMPKHTKRKDSYIVYFKNGDEISQLLNFMGATRAGFELADIIIKKDIRNETNRRVNCEMANMDKQINASNTQLNSIREISQTIGLDSLSIALKQTALLRLENPESSLDELAKISGLTKSCLNHRFRKLNEIANNL